MLAEETSKLQDYIENTEITLQQFETTEIDCQFECVSWLIENENVQYQILNLSHEAAFCLHLNNSGLQDLVSKFIAIKTLNLSYCDLHHVPKLHTLAQLETLILTGNLIEHFNEVVSESVRDVNLEGNPILGYHLDEASLPRLEHLRVGSEHTKYVSLSTLGKIAKEKFELHVAERYLKFLVFPQAHHFIDCDLRNKFVEHAMLDMKNIPDTSKNEAFDWILEHSDLIISLELDSISLSCKIDGLINGLQRTRSLAFLKQLSLKDCGLLELPDVSSLNSLKILDISQNLIAEVKHNYIPKKLKEFHLQQNPISSLDINCEEMSTLKEITFGSESTHYISTPLLKQLLETEMRIILPEQFKKYLHLPQVNVLNDQSALARYIRSPEKYLSQLSKTEQKVEALKWLMLNSQSTFIKLDFDSQEWLRDHRVDLSCIYSENIESLILSNCQLETLPTLEKMPQLKKLNLCKNKFRKISFDQILTSLQVLNIVDNPIQNIDFNFEKLPSLSSITFGSKETWFIGKSVLQQVITGSLELCIPYKFRGFLSLPKWEIIESGTVAIEKYLESSSELNVSHVLGNENKWEAIQLATAEQVLISVIHLTGERDFCHQLSKKLQLSSLFENPSLKFASEVYLSDCGLDCIPDWSHMANLTHADVSGNNLKELPASTTIQWLDVSRNKIAVLALEHLPSVTNIKAGSDSLEFITFKLLKRAAITIEEQHSNSPIMPPSAVLREKDKLQHYLIKPEGYLAHVANRDKLHKAAEWLMCDADFTFSKINLSGQNELFPAGSLVAKFLRGSNLGKITSINLSKCNLNNLPDIEHLQHLERLDVSRNEVREEDLFNLKHPTLQYVDVTMNPIETVHVNFASCPELKEIIVGSNETRCLSVEVLQKVCNGQIMIHFNEEYRKNIVVPPPHIVDTNLSKQEIQIYLTNGEFNLSWYKRSVPSAYLDTGDMLLNIIALDKRAITRFTISKEPELASMIGNNINMILKKFKKVAELDLSNCKMTNLPEVNHMKRLIHLDLSGNQIGKYFELLEDMVASLPDLDHINLSNTALEQIPDFTKVYRLKHLNVANNSITTLAKLEHDNLQTLIVTHNPFPVLDFKPDRLQSLSEVKFGSRNCKFVDFAILQKASSGNMRLTLDRQFRDVLLLPKPDILNRPQAVNNFVHCKELSTNLVNAFDSHEQYACILWITENVRFQYNVFNLTEQALFCASLGDHKINEILKVMQFSQHLKEICLSKCDLLSIPDMSVAPKLEIVDLSQNKIQKLNDSHFPQFLRILNVEQNLIEFIQLDVTKFPNLSNIQCGSISMKYISTQIMERVHRSSLQVIVSPTYINYLQMPPPPAFASKRSLAAYLQHPETYLTSISYQKKRCEAFQWLACEDKFKPADMDLTSQGWIFKCSLDLFMDSFLKLQTLKLNNCDLKELPSFITALPLRFLSLNENKFRFVPMTKLRRLEILEIVDNPINEIDLDPNGFPRLSVLSFGSTQTQYVSFRLLGFNWARNFNLWVPDKYRQNLLWPPWSIIQKGNSTVNYHALSSTLDGQIFPVSQRFTCMKKLLDQDDKIISSFVLSCGEPSETINYNDILDLVAHPSLRFVTEMYVTNWGLESLPKLNHLRNLKHADFSRNKLKSVPTSKSVMTLDVSKNAMETLQLFPCNFPKLQLVKVGSPCLKFISFGVIDKIVYTVPKNDRCCLTKRCVCSLIMPPCILLNHTELLTDYVRNPEKYLIHLDATKIPAAIEWLINEADYKFREINISGQPEIYKPFKLFLQLQNSNIEQITEMRFEQCEIDILPKLDGLKHLEKLLLAGNNLTDISVLKQHNLRYLDVARNPVLYLNVNFNECPNLEEIKAGSPELEVISMILLKRLVQNKLVIHVDEYVPENLIFPPVHIVKNIFDQTKTKEYLDSGVFEVFWFVAKLQSISEERAVVRTLNDILTKDQRRLRVFKMCVDLHVDLRYRIGKNINHILSNANLKNVQHLSLEHCGISDAPDLSSMQYLDVANLSKNQISVINFAHLPTSSLKELDVSQNPIEEFNREFCQLNELRKLTIGSPETKYLAFPFLEKFAENLQLHVNCKESLVYPSYDVVCCQDEFHKFLKEKTITLKTIEESEKKLGAFDWILNSSGFQFNRLHLSGENLLLEKVMISFSCQALQNVTEIHLADCGLEQIPNMSSLKKLDVLIIRNNYIREINCDALPPSLKEIYLSGNPIVFVTVDLTRLRKLKLIDCGSKNTHYISFIILEKVYSWNTSMILVLSEEHRQNLYLPPGELLCDKDGILDYIKNPEKYLASISDHKSRVQALQWLFNESEYKFKTLDFHSQTWLFFKGIDLSCVDLKNTVTLVLSSCELEALPPFDSAQNLKNLDLKKNRFTSLPTGQVFSSLETLNVIGNPLQELDFDNGAFPELKLVMFGSDQTWIVSRRVLSRYSEGGLDLFVPDDYRKRLLFPLWTTIERGSESVRRFLRTPKLDLSGQRELCEKIRMDGISALFNHPSVKTVSYIDISDCNLDDIPEWTGLNSLAKVNISGNKIDRIPKSESLTEINLTKTNINMLALEKDNFPCLRCVTFGSEHLQFILFDTLTRLSVNLSRIPCSALIMPPNFVLSGADRLQQYRAQPEIFLRHVDDDKLPRAIDWLLNESDFHFTCLDLSTQRPTFGSLGPESFKKLFHSTKLKHVTSLNLNECGLDEIPSIESLEKLETLEIVKNQVMCLSKLKNKHLRLINLTENPIETIDVDFEYSPEVAQINAGSEEIKCLSVRVLKRISERKLVIKLAEKYKHLIVLPPPHIVHKGLQPEEVGEYLGKGLFDISWYFTRESDGGSERLIADVKDILSLEKRPVVSFTGDHISDLQDLMDEPILSDVERLNLSDSNVTTLSKFSHFGKLIHLDVSRNPMENEEYQIELPHLSLLNLAECGINDIPSLSRMPHLKELILIRNRISSLITLESKSLESLHVDGNPLSVLDFDVNEVPALTFVTFGSETCQFVNLAILEKIARSEIKVELCPHHTSDLLVPPPDIFKDVQKLSNYVQCPQIDMSMFNTNNPEKQLECIKWLVKHRSIHIDTSILDLAGESLFCNFIDSPGLESLLSTFEHLTEVVLSNCDLSTTPNILKLIQLEKLDLKNNCITKFPDNLPKSLIEIDLQGNPIVRIHFEETRLPNLKILKLGSMYTKYISEDIIRITTDGTLGLILEPGNTQHLIFPPGNRVKDRQSLKQYMDDVSLDLTSISHFEWEETLSWVQNYCPSILKILKAYSMSKTDKKLHDLILYKTTLTKFRNLKQLSINGLGLQYLPDLSGLMSLTVLDCSKNKMESVDLTKLPINSLRNFDISVNPILEFNNDLNSLKKLLKLHIGSPETRYICHPLLERSLSHLELSVHETCQNSLLYPSFRTVTDKEKLKQFVKRRELNLKSIPGPLKQDTLGWLLEKCAVAFETLSLAKQKHFLGEENSSLSQVIEGHSRGSLEEITEINLSDCSLTEIPDISSLKKLTLVDLSNNEIDQINDNFLPMSVENIVLKDNPIPCLAIDCHRFKELQQVQCGSRHTHYVSFQLLEQISEGRIEVTVPREYQEYFLMPPYSLFERHSAQDNVALRNYIEHPENSLIQITDIEKRLTVLNWLLSSAKKDLKSDLSSHTWLSEKSIVLNTISLKNVHTLILSKCDFYEFPTFSDMSALIHLNLSHNNLNKISFEKLPQLQILNVVDNPMNEIDFETEDAPKLNELSFGSPETRFISPRVLRLVKERRKVTLYIPDAHREHLLFPPAIDLNNLEEYVSCNKLGLAVIANPEERLSVIYWQLNQNETNFETLNASNLKNIDLPKIFSHPAFVSVTQVDLSHCDLDHIPDWGMLRIKTANISFNRLHDVPPNPFLETLDVSETIITTLNLRSRNFPVLKCVTAGSHYLEYISFEVLTTLSVQIIDAYKESIIMPPSSVLDDREELGHYIKSPYKYIGKVDSRKVSNAAMWLANDADDQFKKVNFAGLVALFKTSNIDLMWQGRNLSNITYLNIDNCELQVLPELQHLEHLTTLSLVQNSLDNISTLKHSYLQEIYVTENPIEIISFSFSDLPALRKITVGSRSTRVISLNVLTRILTHGLTVIVDSRYRECIMLPPPHVIVSGFEEKTVKEYINNGAFDVQCFVSRIEKKSAAVADELMQILSAEERAVDSFTMCGLPELAQAVGDRIESLLEHKTLQNISNLNLCDCQIAHTPPLQQLNKLTNVDLSGNHIGNDLDKIGDISSKYYVQPISVLKLSNTKLKRIPDIMNLPNLKVLDVSNNQIRSLLNLESESLRNLNVTENECPVVNLNPEKVPKLSKVTFGSANSNFVTFSVLKRVANSQVRLIVAEKHKTSLIIPPPSMLENTESLKKYLKCKEISLQYLNAVDPDVQTKGIEWLIDNEDIIFEAFNLKGERLFCYYIKNLENIFSKMNTITKLILSCCSLTIVPDLRDLVVLRTLDLTCNNIKTLEFIENASVIDVRIHGNPIVGIDFDNVSLPNLKRLSIGSPCTKYISLELLTCAANGDLTLEITEDFESYLVYPMADSIKNRTQIRNFVRNFSLHLELLPVDERKGVFDWVLEHNSSALKSLSLSFSLDSMLNDPILKTFEVENYRFVNLCNLNMSSLDIAFVPDLSSLKHLEELNLSFNRITYVGNLHFPESIQILHIEGNPINDVSISSLNLCNLIELYCGSSSDYSISFLIIEKFVDRTLKLHVAQDSLKNLLLPPEELIGSTEKTAEGRNSLHKYLKSPERYLQTLVSRQTKWKAFSWLISASGKKFESLDFRGMTWILDCHDQDLTHLFDKMSFLNCLKEVSLSNCNISNLNQLHFLPGIEHLDISENKLETLSGIIVRKLKKINVSDNPIKIVDFDPECFPLLNYISFGSDQSTSVSLRVLNLCCKKGLQMHVNEEFRKYLLLPQYEVLSKGKESVEKWIKDNQFSLSHLESDEEKLQALELTTIQREKFYTSINLNSEASLFKSISYERMLTLFASPVFEAVTEAYFRSCDLDNITFVNVLKHLDLLDVADNRIDEIPESKSLKTIILSENNTLVDDHQALSFDLRRCPHLTHITAGSSNMKFISFSIRESLNIDIIPPYHEQILPSKKHLTADTELERYIKEPEQFLTLPKHPDGFWWLMENSDKVFRELNLSNQITSTDTSENIISRLFSSHKFRSVQVLSLENCSLSHLPDLVSLECLEKININNNSIHELLSLKNSSLKYISILNNPIIQISYIVANCKSLTKICCGSTQTKFIDISALGLFAQGSLNINVAEDYIDNILIPPCRMIQSKQDVDLYIQSESFNMALYSNIFSRNRDATNVLKEVLEFEQRKLKSFNMSEEPQIYVQVGADGLEEILKHIKLSDIEEILINKCKLMEIPPISSLGKLRQLNISGNPDILFNQESVVSKVHSNIQELYVSDCDIRKLPSLPDNLEILDISCNNLDSIEVKTSHERLKHLDVSCNPISDLEISPNSFPSLERIKFGSEELVHIGFNLLKHLSDDSRIIRTAPCPNFLFPPRNAFKQGALKDFIRHPYDYIKYVKQEDQRAKVLIWLLENYNEKFKTFTFNYFNNSKEQFSSREYSNLINRYECLQSVVKLDLSNCKLDECPDLTCLTKLLVLNLENNSITRTDEIEKCAYLQKLSVSKNPLEAVDLNINSLESITIGSERTKLIGHQLLQAKSEGRLAIEVPEPYKQVLKYPNYNTVNDNNKLNLFLANPVKDLLNIQDFLDRQLALVWTVTTNQYNFSQLDLSNQMGIFNSMSLEKLNIFLTSTCLQYLKYFSIHNCSVAEIPKFDTHKLEILDLSNNKLRSLELESQFDCLKELYLTGNPLERIEFDITGFRKLEKLECGSQDTKYISVPILERVTQGLKLIIPKSCQTSLLLPKYKTIESHRSKLLKFIKSPEKYIPSQISDLNDRKNIIMWLFNGRKNQTSFGLDNQKDLNALLKKLLDEPSLVKIEILSLKESDLTFLPDLKQLENLKTLDISKNHISDLNYDYIPYSIERINIEGNPLKFLNIEQNVLRAWELTGIKKTIQCGSTHIRFISFDVARLHHEEFIHIVITSYYQHLLLMPSYSTLSGANLSDYLSNPDNYLNEIPRYPKNERCFGISF